MKTKLKLYIIEDDVEVHSDFSYAFNIYAFLNSLKSLFSIKRKMQIINGRNVIYLIRIIIA
jgi:hypothetical protein